MDPKLWGKGFWMLIWCILYDEDRFPNLYDVKRYLDTICRNLPCDLCRDHIQEKITEYNIMSSNSRDDIREFFMFVYSTSSGNKLSISLDKKYNERV